MGWPCWFLISGWALVFSNVGLVASVRFGLLSKPLLRCPLGMLRRFRWGWGLLGAEPLREAVRVKRDNPRGLALG